MGEPVKVTDGAGALYVVNADLSTRKALSGITISNGLAWGEAFLVMFGLEVFLRHTSHSVCALMLHKQTLPERRCTT